MSHRPSAVLLFAAAAASVFACAPTSRATGGVVSSDMRDVERDAEGLVSTTFGTAMDRTPAWDRAGAVLSLLQIVWNRAKQANPGFPAAQVSAVDAAVATLVTAIPAHDQRAAAYASNAIGLAMPELFDYFHPDAPQGVIRMDAVFRQVGIDGHFGDLAAVRADVASLRSDWGTVRDAVATRAPTCHRVGGTTTVSDDINQSLTALDAAIAAMDVPTIEIQSDNGALEIDTLELLFDCPPDGAAPPSGIGAPCTTNANCGTDGLVCDTANAGGRCAPPPSNRIGTACTSTIDCGTDPREACATEAGDNYPGGYCTMEPCNDVDVCPPGGTCVALGGEIPACFHACATDADCRGADHYVCQLFVTTPPRGFGPSDHACAFACTRDADCQSPLTCDIASGRCRP